MRLSQYLSAAGVCSRRRASQWINDGRVSVNEQVADQHTRVASGDIVHVDGQVITLPDTYSYVIYNKPVGVDCNCRADNPASIINHLPLPMRLFPVGRLDKDSHGLLLLTNDGVLCERLLSPDTYHPKTYHVQVRPHRGMPDINLDFKQRMQQGVDLEGVLTRPCQVTLLGPNRFEVVLTQGLNRQIRRMARALGYHVTDLQRTQLVHLTLRGLSVGQHRPLTADECASLLSLRSRPPTTR